MNFERPSAFSMFTVMLVVVSAHLISGAIYVKSDMKLPACETVVLPQFFPRYVNLIQADQCARAATEYQDIISTCVVEDPIKRLGIGIAIAGAYGQNPLCKSVQLHGPNCHLECPGMIINSNLNGFSDCSLLENTTKCFLTNIKQGCDVEIKIMDWFINGVGSILCPKIPVVPEFVGGKFIEG